MGTPTVVAPEGQRAEAGVDDAGKLSAVGQLALAGAALASGRVGFGLGSALGQQAQRFFDRVGQRFFDVAQV